MAAGKKSFVVYTSWKIWLDGMTKEQKGDWIDWMFDYTNDLNPELPIDPVVKMACLMCRETLKRDLQKYEDRVERIKSARNQNPNNNKELNKINSQTDNELKSVSNHTEISSVNVNVNDNVNDNVNVLSNDNDNICAEMGDTISTLPAIKCPKGYETGFNVYQSDVDKWQQVYTGVDVKHELQKMQLWLEANPKSRKTYRGMPAFINNWLSRAQDQASKYNKNNKPVEAPKTDNGGFIDLMTIEDNGGFTVL